MTFAAILQSLFKREIGLQFDKYSKFFFFFGIKEKVTVLICVIKAIFHKMSTHLPEASIKFNCKPVKTRCFVVFELVKRICTFFYCYQVFAAFCFIIVELFKVS